MVVQEHRSALSTQIFSYGVPTNQHSKLDRALLSLIVFKGVGYCGLQGQNVLGRLSVSIFPSLEQGVTRSPDAVFVALFQATGSLAKTDSFKQVTQSYAERADSQSFD